MIEKMKFLSVTGPKEDIDRVVNDYLSKYEIHLENALSELKTVKSLRPYIEINPYKDKLTKAEEFASMLGTDKNQENPTGTISIEEASETLATLESKFSDIYTRTNALEAKKEDLKASYERLRPFLGFDFDVLGRLPSGALAVFADIERASKLAVPVRYCLEQAFEDVIHCANASF